MKSYIGLDVGNKYTKIVLIDITNNIIYKNSIPTTNIINNVKYLFKELKNSINDNYQVYNIGLTGDNRFIIGKLLSSEIINNEIECIYKYAKENKLEGNILEISNDNNKILNIKNSELIDYKIYNSTNIVNQKFIDKVSSSLNISLNNINMNKYINFNNDNLLLLYDEIRNSKVNKKIIISSLYIKLFNTFKFNYLLGDLSINKSILKYINQEYRIENYYAKSLGAAYIAKYSKSNKIYSLDIENNTIERRINKCNKCSNSCEIVSIYRNHELVDYFGNNCDKGKIIEFNNRIYSKS